MTQRKYLIFTKGSAQTQNNKSAYGYKILDTINGKERHDTQSFYGGTANREELLAIIKALEKIISYRSQSFFKESFTIISPSNVIINQLKSRNQVAHSYITNDKFAYYLVSNPAKGPLLTKITYLMLHFKNIHIKYLTNKYDKNNINLKHITNKALNTKIPVTQHFQLPSVSDDERNQLMSYYQRNKIN